MTTIATTIRKIWTRGTGLWPKTQNGDAERDAEDEEIVKKLKELQQRERALIGDLSNGQQNAYELLAL